MNQDNQDVAKAIVNNANAFARSFLSLEGIMIYMEELLKAYTELLIVEKIQLENSAIEVTNRRI